MVTSVSNISVEEIKSQPGSTEAAKARLASRSSRDCSLASYVAQFNKTVCQKSATVNSKGWWHFSVINRHIKILPAGPPFVYEPLATLLGSLPLRMSFTCVKNNLADAMKKNPPDSWLCKRLSLSQSVPHVRSNEVSVPFLQPVQSNQPRRAHGKCTGPAQVIVCICKSRHQETPGPNYAPSALAP